MALVMLPCDLPWWPAVAKQLDRAAQARASNELVDAMQRLHDMCNISLDPEEDIQDSHLFDGLAKYLNEDLTTEEREHVLGKTIPRIVGRAKALKTHKPPQGLHFSLQQQGDTIEHSYAFVASLIANAFFSTYPKRTPKTHPTLRDFNFTHFFKHLNLKSQKAKLESIFHYFDYLETCDSALDGHLLISRQVMLSRQWLTIEDWLESDLPLCPLRIRHEGRLERTDNGVQVCFASSSFGDGVLEAHATQETIQVASHPELLAVMLCVESLEDNEALIVEGLRRVSKILDPKHRATFEAITQPTTITACCIDAEDYSQLPLAQYEEDNVLRELNKSLLGFRQRRPPQSPTIDASQRHEAEGETGPGTRRLSPIGESFSSPSPEIEEAARKARSIHNSASSQASMTPSNETCRTRGNGLSSSPCRNVAKVSGNSGRSRFIVLGSSGEALPVTRTSIAQTSQYHSCSSQSTDDSYHSAKDTVDEPDNDEEVHKQTRRYSEQLDTPERRGTFAQRLKEALKRESSATRSSSYTETTSESSYAVDICVSGSHVDDPNIKVRRGGSRGFVLRDETVDEDFLKESLEAEQKWLGRFRQSQHPGLQRKDTSTSSRYSFSTEYSSELEEVYEQLSKWLEEPVDGEPRELDARDRAVVTFAGSLLKRALSESFAGVPVQEGEPQPLFDATDANQRRKLALAVRSLSLELARQRSRRHPSVSRDDSPQEGGLQQIATGNWGCGSRLKGDPQLKLVIQWLAASVAGVPRLVYYTFGHSKLSKLDTVSRVLTDRQWSVGDLASATLRFSTQSIEERRETRNSLFEELIGVDKPSP
ncbi:uncharacterized protein LOC131673367 isoform X2 [Phymastichus coffea]|uniref:uncharacterized protein LOC131673367 isoform X2 n=1 Tax=Phymastichus coffea TaxID=108790 RepID=UPI00273C71C4|nr:uncharacterized protein LOC131673367 isoform X2 [Phymastichus coffea]